MSVIPLRRSADLEVLPADFMRFWSLYPRRVKRTDALKAWLALTEIERALAIEVMPRHVQSWDSEGREMQYIPYPATWLRAGQMYDELQVEAPRVVCRWPGCEKRGTEKRGTWDVCAAHKSALDRGETP